MNEASPAAQSDRTWLTSAAINRLLEAGGRWTHGPLHSVRPQRIGVGYGLSGRVYRVAATGVDGSPVSLVAKFERAAEIGRAVAFRTANEAAVRAWIPSSYGSRIDDAADRGVILLEDIDPSTQGDDLLGCSREQAHDIVAVVAEVHAATWVDAGPRVPSAWSEPVWETERWQDRIRVAAARCPDDFTAETVAALGPLNEAAGKAIGALATAPTAWIHRDPHPDNVLWRADGRPVLIDWSGAGIGPAAIDVAVLLTSLTFRTNPPLGPEELLEWYTEELTAAGVPVTAAEVAGTARLALVARLRGMVGWAGIREHPEPAGRYAAVRDVAPGRVVAGLRWLTD